MYTITQNLSDTCETSQRIYNGLQYDYLVPIKQFITPKRMVSTRNVRSAPMTRRTFRSGGGY